MLIVLAMHDKLHYVEFGRNPSRSETVRQHLPLVDDWRITPFPQRHTTPPDFPDIVQANSQTQLEHPLTLLSPAHCNAKAIANNSNVYTDRLSVALFFIDVTG